MATQQYCAYNQTQECFLGLHVTTTSIPASALQQQLSTLSLRADEALLLEPCPDLPRCDGTATLDLLFLDRDRRVVAGIESWTGNTAIESPGEAVSLLILAGSSLYSSNTHNGDQLLLCAAEDLCRELEDLSSSRDLSLNAATTDAISYLRNELPPALQREFDPDAQERRHAPRFPGEELDAGFCYGPSTESRPVRDISSSGLYLITDERWFPGTLVRLALRQKHSKDLTLDIHSRVMRWGQDGVGLQFIESERNDSQSTSQPTIPTANPERLRSLLDLLPRKNNHS